MKKSDFVIRSWAKGASGKMKEVVSWYTWSVSWLCAALLMSWCLGANNASKSIVRPPTSEPLVLVWSICLPVDFWIWTSMSGYYQGSCKNKCDQSNSISKKLLGHSKFSQWVGLAKIILELPSHLTKSRVNFWNSCESRKNLNTDWLLLKLSSFLYIDVYFLVSNEAAYCWGSFFTQSVWIWVTPSHGKKTPTNLVTSIYYVIFPEREQNYGINGKVRCWPLSWETSKS